MLAELPMSEFMLQSGWPPTISSSCGRVCVATLPRYRRPLGGSRYRIPVFQCDTRPHPLRPRCSGSARGVAIIWRSYSSQWRNWMRMALQAGRVLRRLLLVCPEHTCLVRMIGLVNGMCVGGRMGLVTVPAFEVERQGLCLGFNRHHELTGQHRTIRRIVRLGPWREHGCRY